MTHVIEAMTQWPPIARGAAFLIVFAIEIGRGLLMVLAWFHWIMPVCEMIADNPPSRLKIRCRILAMLVAMVFVTVFTVGGGILIGIAEWKYNMNAFGHGLQPKTSAFFWAPVMLSLLSWMIFVMLLRQSGD